MLIFKKWARNTKQVVAVCLCSRGLMSEEKSASLIEAIRLDLRSWRGRMSSALVLTHLLFLVFKETLSHALPRTVAGSVSNGAAKLQAGLATVAGEERSATPPGYRSGIIPPSFHPLTHCGTISVSKMYHPAHMQAPVPLYPYDTVLCRASLRYLQGEEPQRGPSH